MQVVLIDPPPPEHLKLPIQESSSETWLEIQSLSPGTPQLDYGGCDLDIAEPAPVRCGCRGSHPRREFCPSLTVASVYDLRIAKHPLAVFALVIDSSRQCQNRVLYASPK